MNKDIITMNGWVARDENGDLWLCENKPYIQNGRLCEKKIKLPNYKYQDLKFWDPPVEVILTIETEITAPMLLAKEMLSIVLHDTDMETSDEYFDESVYKLGRLLTRPFDQLGGWTFFTDEMNETFSIGDSDDVKKILEEHEILKPAHDFLEEFFEKVADEGWNDDEND